MGSKTALLTGKLGEILLTESVGAHRFVDLFAGSGAVARFMAQRTSIPVLSVDLQQYAQVFAAAVIERTEGVTENLALLRWLSTPTAAVPLEDASMTPLTASAVRHARAAAAVAPDGFITRHYGGHYFSLDQARALDAFYKALPTCKPAKTVALASLLQAASVCAASPGHTAQPFQPTQSLLPYIEQSWSRNVSAAIRNAFNQIAPVFVRVKGEAIVDDAQFTVSTLREGDLVFCDPPYSAVQYSRFYHVLEGIARGGWDEVGGNGRAPETAARKSSDFSRKSKATAAMTSLLQGLREKNCRAIITFPDTHASNGMSGQDIITMAADRWNVEPYYVDSVHSTLGGSKSGTLRGGGRRRLKEAVIVLSPKSRVRSTPIKMPRSAELPVLTGPSPAVSA